MLYWESALSGEIGPRVDRSVFRLEKLGTSSPFLNTEQGFFAHGCVESLYLNPLSKDVPILGQIRLGAIASPDDTYAVEAEWSPTGVTFSPVCSQEPNLAMQGVDTTSITYLGEILIDLSHRK